MILIIGYGNPLRGDDGVGWRVAEQAAVSLADAPVAVLTVHQLTPELAEPISRAGRVVFVDAAAEGEPGTVNCFGLEDTGQRPVLQPIGSHLTTPDALLAMAGELFGRRPPATMVTIAGESFAVSEALTPGVEGAIPAALALILELVGRHDATG